MPSASTNVVEFVLQPKALLNHPVTFIKQVASTVFNFLLKAADLVGQVLDVGLCLPAVVIAPEVGWQPAGFAPLLKLRWHTAETRVFCQCFVAVAELPIKQALGVSGLAITPVPKNRMWTGKHDQKLR